ncbi:MAG: LysE family translocator [Pegethrix bostrychoides GSE-TBD4-15B]|jgi:threonine/homoserine/homoserine lactone efflux protein|uniref:LysE family translocator n=1 Tax=Pegethrix bostrychoides GSE-TBD4-15B TaxID=2839662 RepID=A0A951U5W0_9CYAN|nr:LysE family translocator [Pegethrix bostrychoides GSE-TBD4-15B]
MNDFFLRGLILGFSIAAPVGPIGVLAIRRTLAAGWRIGLATGLGAATADGVYGCIAGFGLTLVSGFLVGQAFWLKLFGGLFLCYLGMQTFRAKPAAEAASVKSRGLLEAYGSTFLLTLTNPATILSFSALFAGLGVADGSYFNASLLVLGVFCGSALWWLTLSSSVSLFRSRISSQLKWLNRISGLILLVFGIIALSSIPY